MIVVVKYDGYIDNTLDAKLYRLANIFKSESIDTSYDYSRKEKREIKFQFKNNERVIAFVDQAERVIRGHMKEVKEYRRLKPFRDVMES